MTVPVADQIAWSLARQCVAGDVVVVGVATPLAAAAALLARELLVPDLTLIVAASVDPAVHDVSLPLLDPGAVARRSVGTFGQAQVLDLLQRGGVTLQFVSPAQVDQAGRVNASRVRGTDGALGWLPGGLALPDVSVLVGRLVAYRAEHSGRFLVPTVDFVTGAGSSDQRLRARYGLSGRGVVAAVTGRAVLRWDVEGVRLVSTHGGTDAETTRALTGFPLLAPAPVPMTEAPPAEARRLLDGVIDPRGMRRLEVRAERTAAMERLLSAAP